MNQKLEGYETVKERKKRFREDHPDGRIETELVFQEDGHAIIKALVFMTAQEQKDRLPVGTGYAEEFKGQGGFANKYSWMENCEESAVGRALDNAGYAGSCSREEMEKVERGNNGSYSVDAKKPEKISVSKFVTEIDLINTEEQYRNLWKVAGHQGYAKGEADIIKQAFDRALLRIKEAV